MKKSPFWWIDIGINGRQQSESSKQTEHAKAKELLAIREGKIAKVRTSHQRLPPGVHRGRRNAGARLHGPRLLDPDELQLRLRLHLLPYFGHYKMVDIDTAMIRRYIGQRQAARRIAAQGADQGLPRWPPRRDPQRSSPMPQRRSTESWRYDPSKPLASR